jgi:protein-L-isoaspartate O-methyltransferase
MTASTVRELADALQESGAVRSPWLRRAFAQTPREVFVPRFYRVENGQDVLVDPMVPERRAEWLRGVYTDEALVVQVTPAPDFGGPECLPTSSSSMPP